MQFIDICLCIHSFEGMICFVGSVALCIQATKMMLQHAKVTAAVSTITSLHRFALIRVVGSLGQRRE